MRRYSALWLCLFVGLLADADAFAQSQATTAEINGRVNDAQGGVLPGATVTARSEATGYARTVATNEEGLFTIPLLPPGSYEVTAELTSFAPATRTLTLTVGATVTINYALQLGGVTEKVTVAGGAQIIETGATIRTTTVDQQAIANLPINGRRFQDFVTLTPTVQVDPQRGQLSFAGQRGINANVSIDGADYNQPFFGGIRGGERSNNAFTVPQESVQEFQVVAAGYSAEFGRSTGGLVNVITKSGTNALHGSGFYLNRNRDWADENAFGQVAAPDAAPVRHLLRRPDCARSRCSSSGPTSSRSSPTPARSPSTSPASRPSTTTARPTTTTGRSKPTSMPPTTPRRCSGAWTTR